MTDISNHIEAVAKALLGEPNPKLSSKTELRYGNNGSLSVDLKGTWFNHETSKGGGVADLIRKHNPLANVPEFLESIGIEVDKPNGHANGHDTIKSSLVATYPYADENGEVLYEVLRFEPKTFRQRRYVDGKAVWGLGDTQPYPTVCQTSSTIPPSPSSSWKGRRTRTHWPTWALWQPAIRAVLASSLTISLIFQRA